MQQQRSGGSMHLSRGGSRGSSGNSRPRGTTAGDLVSEDKKLRPSRSFRVEGNNSSSEALVARSDDQEQAPLTRALVAAAAAATTTTTNTTTSPTSTNSIDHLLLTELSYILKSTTTTRWSKIESFISTNTLSDLDFDNMGCNEDELLIVALIMLFRVAVQVIQTSTTTLNINRIFTLIYNLVCDIKNVYEPNPYHSFRHAVDVAQAMYSLLTTILITVFQPREVFYLLLACLLHDVKHNGSTNAALRARNDPIIIRYGSLEQYHVAVASEVMKNHQIVLEEILGLTKPADKIWFMEEIKRLILSTDPDRHDADVNEMQRNSSRAHQQSTLIRLCDISNVIRPFNEAKAWVDRLILEMIAINNSSTTPLQPADIATWFSINKAMPLIVGFSYCGLKNVTELLQPRLQRNIEGWAMMKNVLGRGNTSNGSSSSSSSSQKGV
jgi:hypothetical protein